MTIDVHGFMQAYGAAFERGPAAIAQFYSEPCITAVGWKILVQTMHDETA
ncbi:MAG TPA: hypothetical protein VM491_10210 [Burkholderiaceae bacterium]|nr:hypothetical protein [Burkholderiaceae bacterium]